MLTGFLLDLTWRVYFKRHREPYQEILKHDAKMAKLMNVGEGLGIMTSNFHQIVNV